MAHLAQTQSLVQVLHPTAPSSLVDTFTSHLVPFLLSTTIFTRLASLQRDLDALSISTLLHPPYLKHQPLSSIPPPTLSELAEFASAYVSGSRSPVWSNREHLLAFILSTTFKDCSLIFRLPIGTDPGSIEVKAIDLDLKPVGKLAKWAALDKEILDHFTEVLARGENVRRCTDGQID